MMEGQTDLVESEENQAMEKMISIQTGNSIESRQTLSEHVTNPMITCCRPGRSNEVQLPK